MVAQSWSPVNHAFTVRQVAFCCADPRPLPGDGGQYNYQAPERNAGSRLVTGLSSGLAGEL